MQRLRGSRDSSTFPAFYSPLLRACILSNTHCHYAVSLHLHAKFTFVAKCLHLYQMMRAPIFLIADLRWSQDSELIEISSKVFYRSCWAISVFCTYWCGYGHAILKKAMYKLNARKPIVINHPLPVNHLETIFYCLWDQLSLKLYVYFNWQSKRTVKEIAFPNYRVHMTSLFLVRINFRLKRSHQSEFTRS